MHAQAATPADGQWPVLDALVDRVLDARRQVAAAQATEARLLAEAVDVIADRTALLRQQAEASGQPFASASDLPLREVSLELGAAMRVSDRTVQARISEAFALTQQYPATHAALASGKIDLAHATAIVRAGTGVPDDARERYEKLALDAAATESAPRTAQAAKAIAAALCPETFAERARSATDERDVRLFDLDEGMVRLIADLPAPSAGRPTTCSPRAPARRRPVACPSHPMERPPRPRATMNPPQRVPRTAPTPPARLSGTPGSGFRQVRARTDSRVAGRSTRARWRRSVPTSSASYCSPAFRRRARATASTRT